MVQNAYHIRSALLALAPTVDLTGVVSTLESHWVVLDAELSEIRKDFAVLRALTRKHGEFWMRPMAQLKKLRTQKENLLKECVRRPRDALGRASAVRAQHADGLSCASAPRPQDQVPDGAVQSTHPARARPVHQALERRVGDQDATSAAAVTARHRSGLAHPGQLAKPVAGDKRLVGAAGSCARIAYRMVFLFGQARAFQRHEQVYERHLSWKPREFVAVLVDRVLLEVQKSHARCTHGPAPRVHPLRFGNPRRAAGPARRQRAAAASGSAPAVRRRRVRAVSTGPNSAGRGIRQGIDRRRASRDYGPGGPASHLRFTPRAGAVPWLLPADRPAPAAAASTYHRTRPRPESDPAAVRRVLSASQCAHCTAIHPGGAIPRRARADRHLPTAVPATLRRASAQTLAQTHTAMLRYHARA